MYVHIHISSHFSKMFFPLFTGNNFNYDFERMHSFTLENITDFRLESKLILVMFQTNVSFISLKFTELFHRGTCSIINKILMYSDLESISIIYRGSYLVPTHFLPTNYVLTYCQFLVLVTLNLWKIETSFTYPFISKYNYLEIALVLSLSDQKSKRIS